MPVLPSPDFKPPLLQWNAHLQTIFPSLFRKVSFRYQTRERLELPDGDFVDLDWHLASPARNRIVIITHGLEGDSGRQYVTGMAKIFIGEGYDALGWNCRSCSGEINRLLRFYHHGDAGDLRYLIHHVIRKYGYNEIILVGFSMGGSLTLRAVGEFPDEVPPQVKKTVTFSVPCDLLDSVNALVQPGNKVYMKRFLKKLGKKIRQKEKMFPGSISSDGYDAIRHFADFDDRYTAPLHGYKDAYDFYARASVKPLLAHIRVPSLIIQALNDPFISTDSIPVEEAMHHPWLFLETSVAGGHCGFMMRGEMHTYAEQRALAFVLGK